MTRSAMRVIQLYKTSTWLEKELLTSMNGDKVVAPKKKQKHKKQKIFVAKRKGNESFLNFNHKT